MSYYAQQASKQHREFSRNACSWCLRRPRGGLLCGIFKTWPRYARGCSCSVDSMPMGEVDSLTMLRGMMPTTIIPIPYHRPFPVVFGHVFQRNWPNTHEQPGEKLGVCFRQK